MLALSIQQPYAWLIVHGYKNIENRDWTTSYHGLLLIHAGKKIDRTVLLSREWESKNLAMPDHWKAAWSNMPENADFETGGIVGYATLQKVVTDHTSPWFVGKYGFVLMNCHPLPFIIPCRGQLGLFEVPQEVAVRVQEYLAK